MPVIDTCTTFAYGDKDTSETLGDFLLSPLRCWSARKVEPIKYDTFGQSFQLNPVDRDWLDIAGCILTVVLFPLTLIATLFGTLCYSLSSTRKEKTSDFVMQNLEQLIRNNKPGTLANVEKLLMDYEDKYDLNTPKGTEILFWAIDPLSRRREGEQQAPLETIDTINRLINFGANPFRPDNTTNTPIGNLFYFLATNPIVHCDRLECKLYEFTAQVNTFTDGHPPHALARRVEITSSPTFLLHILHVLVRSKVQEIPKEIVIAVTGWIQQYMRKDPSLQQHPDYDAIQLYLQQNPILNPITTKLIQHGATGLSLMGDALSDDDASSA